MHGCTYISSMHSYRSNRLGLLMYNDIEKAIDETLFEILKEEAQTDNAAIKTINLLKRKLNGDNPKDEEWKEAYTENYIKKYGTEGGMLTFYNARRRTNNVSSLLVASMSTEGSELRPANPVFKKPLFEKLKKFIKPVHNLDLKIYKSVAQEKKYNFEMGEWHSPCGTEHCRAGAAIIEHPRGHELETYLRSRIAGEFIYQISTGAIPDFHCSNEEAWEDIKRCAGVA